MLTGSISLGRLAGAALRVHWSAILIAALLAAVWSHDAGLAVAVIAVVGFFASILVHELAHAVVARRFDVKTTAIELWALGGMARLDHDPRTARAEGWIAAAGPLSSIAIGAAAVGAAFGVRALAAPDTLVAVLASLGALNVLLGVFNLLPGAPLDGGRIVRAVRWAQHGNRYRAMREAGQAGRVLGWGLGALGLAFLFDGRLGGWGLWVAFTGMFIAVNARAEMAMADLGERLNGVKVGDLTWFGVAETNSEMDADSMIWQRSRLGGAGAVAVRGNDGELNGLVLEDQLWAVPVEQRPWVMLTSLMMPFSRLAQADPDDELASVLPKLNPLRPVVTVWRDGRLLGVIPPATLRQKLAPRPTI
jgi:Zn-dependent protease